MKIKKNIFIYNKLSRKMNENKTKKNQSLFRKYTIKFGKGFTNSWKNIFKKDKQIEILSEFIFYDNNKKTIEDLKGYIYDLLNYSCCPCNIRICSNKVNDETPPYIKSLKFYEEENKTLLSKLNLQNSFYVVELTDIECECTSRFKKFFKLTKMELIKILYSLNYSNQEKEDNKKKFSYDFEVINKKLKKKIEDLLEELEEKDKRIEDIKLKSKKENNYFPKPILYENFEKINQQIKNGICKLKSKNGKEGLGFFCKIPFPNKNNLLPVIITKNIIINKEILENENEIGIKVGNLETNISLRDIIKFSSEKYKLTIIEIKDLNYKNIHYFELDEKIIENLINENDDIEFNLNEMVYTIQYFEKNFYISFGTLAGVEDNIKNFNNINNNENVLLNISPIININNNKVIGLNDENINNINGFISESIKEFIEIKYYIKNAINNFNLTEEKKVIGKGGFGTVYLIENNNKRYALKRLPLINIEKEDLINYEKEAKILSNLNCEYIVKYYDSFKDKDYFNIVMEYAGKSNLKKFICEHSETKKLINENIINNIIFQIYFGLKEIHKSNIIHRDLKPENIFIDENNKILIGDFGISKILETNRKYAFTKSGTFN